MSSESQSLVQRVVGSEDQRARLTRAMTLGSVGVAMFLIPSTLAVVLATYSGTAALDALVAVNAVALLWLVVVLFGPPILDRLFEE